MAAVMSERPSIDERLGVAVASNNLTPHEHACPLDKVVALGVICRRFGLADHVVALKHANDRSAYDDMLSAVRGLAAKLNNAKGWRINPRLNGIARSVLDYWLDDACKSCDGVGHRATPGLPIRASKSCAVCCGSGKRARPWARLYEGVPPPKHKRRDSMARWYSKRKRIVNIINCHEMLIRTLDDTERAIGGMAVKLLR